MTRRFFDQIDDELRGLLGPSLSRYECQRSSRLIKLWFGDPAAHFEAQFLSERWSPRAGSWIEVGLHLEAATAAQNEELLQRIDGSREQWAGFLDGATSGNCYGPRADDWRRISELIELEDPDDPDFASEIAERVATYVRRLQPLLDQLNRPIRADEAF